MIITSRYAVLDRAREITKVTDLDVLENRKYLGVPLARDMLEWMSICSPRRLLCIDFQGIRVVTMSVAEELGPALMARVQQMATLDHRFPVFALQSPEPIYTFGRAFGAAGMTALAITELSTEDSTISRLLSSEDSCSVVVLGQLTSQMEAILRFADDQTRMDRPISSDDLHRLDFMAEVSAAARSKRLTELYTRRLLSWEENPRNPKERLFVPAWRLPK